MCSRCEMAPLCRFSLDGAAYCLTAYGQGTPLAFFDLVV